MAPEQSFNTLTCVIYWMLLQLLTPSRPPTSFKNWAISFSCAGPGVWGWTCGDKCTHTKHHGTDRMIQNVAQALNFDINRLFINFNVEHFVTTDSQSRIDVIAFVDSTLTVDRHLQTHCIFINANYMHQIQIKQSFMYCALEHVWNIYKRFWTRPLYQKWLYI